MFCYVFCHLLISGFVCGLGAHGILYKYTYQLIIYSHSIVKDLWKGHICTRFLIYLFVSMLSLVCVIFLWTFYLILYGVTIVCWCSMIERCVLVWNDISICKIRLYISQFQKESTFLMVVSWYKTPHITHIHTGLILPIRIRVIYIFNIKKLVIRKRKMLSSESQKGIN